MFFDSETPIRSFSPAFPLFRCSCFLLYILVSFASLISSNSFTIRTSETPLPQLLYNPHLQTPLGSAGNKGLITPLESALTRNSPASRLESALAETWGWGPCSPPRNSQLTTHQLQITIHAALPN